MKNFKFGKKAALPILMTIFFASCAPKNPHAPLATIKDNLEANPPIHYPRPTQNIRFVNNILFMWSEDMDIAEVRKVSRAAGQIAKLDHDIGPINQQIGDLNLAKEKLQPLVLKARGDKIKANATLSKARKDLKAATDEMSDIDQKLGATPQPPADEIERLKKRRSELDSVSPQLVLAVNNAQAAFEKASALVNQIAAQIADLDKQIEPLAQAQEDNSRKIVEQSGIIKDQVDGFNQAVTFLVQPEKDGSLSISIENWTLEGDGKGEPLGFSTAPNKDGRPTIGNVNYTELGGVLKFEVYIYSKKNPARVAPKDIYQFTLARVGDDSGDGKISMSGDLIRSRTTTYGPILRRGVVKLSDRKSN